MQPFFNVFTESMSSLQKCRDFIGIGLQLGSKFGKSKGLSTETAERLEIGPDQVSGPCILSAVTENPDYHVALQVFVFNF